MSSFAVEMNKVIGAFVAAIADKYDLDRAQVMQLWDESSPKESKESKEAKEAKESSPQESSPKESKESKKPSTEKKRKSESTDPLAKLGKPELVAQCKARGLSVSGTKDDLIARLNGNGINPNPSSKDTEKDTEKPSSKDAVKEPEKKKKCNVSRSPRTSLEILSMPRQTLSLIGLRKW